MMRRDDDVVVEAALYRFKYSRLGTGGRGGVVVDRAGDGDRAAVDRDVGKGAVMAGEAEDRAQNAPESSPAALRS